MTTKFEETVSFLRTKGIDHPEIGIVLGTGLHQISEAIETIADIPYSSIPNFPLSTVESHSGMLTYGTYKGKKVLLMKGRFHFYEGYTAQQVAYPVRVMQMLGVQTLLLSNAAGGVNPAFQVGDLMIIRDHISLFQVNPLLGKNEDALGTRFPDMSEPYNKQLIQQVKNLAAANSIQLHEGVYLGVTGPTFETRAEYKLIHVLGGDAVGMSTVQETIAAVHAGMKVFAISVITDLGIREEENTITHEEVLQAAAAAEPILTLLFTQLVQQLPA
jgi:purine-nucleoside phosphorylase